MASSCTEEIQTNIGLLVTKLSPEENIWSSTTSINGNFDSATNKNQTKVTLDLHLKGEITLSLRAATGPEHRLSIQDGTGVDKVVKTFENDKGDSLQVEVKLHFNLNHVFITLLNGQRRQIPVDLTKDTVASLKSKAEKMWNIAPNGYLFAFGYFELAPDQRLISDFNMVRGSEIKLQPLLLETEIIASGSRKRLEQGKAPGGDQPGTSTASYSKAPPIKKPRTDVVHVAKGQPVPSTSQKAICSGKSGLQQPSASNGSGAATIGKQPSPFSSGKSVYCFCRKKQNSSFMVWCSACVEWYHGKCVNFTQAEYDILARGNPDYRWKCPACLKMAEKYPAEQET